MWLSQKHKYITLTHIQITNGSNVEPINGVKMLFGWLTPYLKILENSINSVVLWVNGSDMVSFEEWINLKK